MPGAASAEGRLVFAHSRDRPSKLPDHERTKRGVDPQRVIDRDVDDLICELRNVAGPNVVPPPVRERKIEHRLVGEVGFGHAQIEYRRSDLLDRARVAAHHAHHQLAVQLPGHEGKWWRLPAGYDRHEFVRYPFDPLAVEA